jgi:hypothetical protein
MFKFLLEMIKSFLSPAKRWTIRFSSTLTEKELFQSSNEYLESISSTIQKLREQPKFKTIGIELAEIDKQLSVVEIH